MIFKKKINIAQIPNTLTQVFQFLPHQSLIFSTIILNIQTQCFLDIFFQIGHSHSKVYCFPQNYFIFNKTIINLFEFSILSIQKTESMTSNFPLIPDQAFLYFPKETDMVEYKNGHPHRIIFDGGVPYTQEEKNKIADFKAQMNKKQKNNNIQSYPDNTLLRFLQANQFNNTNCIKSLRDYKVWEDKSIPIRLTPEIQGLLKQGILYLSGRDFCFRPIIVVNVGKILELKPKEKLFLQTLGYFFQFIIENCLIEGQIQNWVSIIDLGNASVFSLGGTLVDTITFLSSNFRARVHHSYLVNAPSSIKFVWGMVKGAMNEDQLRKLSLSSKKQLGEDDFKEINKSQVQKKYGGTKENIVKFWPIMPIEQNFKTEKSKEVRLISVQQYTKKYQNRQLLNRKINNKYIHCKQLGLNRSESNFSKKFKQSAISQRSHSSNNDMTRSQVSQDLNDLNSRIPKQRHPPQIPVIPESFSFQDFVDSIVKKIFS